MGLNLIHSPDVNPAWRDIIVNAVFNVLGIVVVCLRLYSRRLTRAGFGWDDGLIVVSTLIVNGMLIVTGFQISIGFGRPMKDVEPNSIKTLTVLGRACRFLFLFSICFVKLSALFFYLRVFGSRTVHIIPNTATNATSNANSADNCNRSLHSEASNSSHARQFWRSLIRPSQRLVYMYLIGAIILWTIANLIQELTVCGYHKPMCPEQRATDLGICVFNAFADLVVLALPLWPIWRLKMKTGTKAGLTFVFLLGTVTIIVAFLRFGAILYTQYGGDFIESAMKSANYAILEANLAILCISLPMLQPLIRGMRKYFKQHSTRSSSENASDLSPSSPSWWRRLFEFRDRTSSGDRGTNGNENGNGGNGTIDIGKSVTFGVVRSANAFPPATSPTDLFSDAHMEAQNGLSDDGGDGDRNGGTSVRQSRGRSRNKNKNRDEGLASRFRSIWGYCPSTPSLRASDDTMELTRAMGMGVTTTITGGMR